MALRFIGIGWGVLFLTFGASPAGGDDSNHASLGRPVGPEAFGKLWSECVASLSQAKVANVASPTRGGNFVISAGHDGNMFYFVSKVGNQHALERISINQPRGKVPALVQTAAGEKFELSADNFASNANVRPRQLCDGESPAVGSSNLPLEKIVTFNNDNKESLEDSLIQFFNNTLGIPLGGAYGPVPDSFKSNKKALESAVEKCQALGATFPGLNRRFKSIIENLAKLPN